MSAVLGRLFAGAVLVAGGAALAQTPAELQDNDVVLRNLGDPRTNPLANTDFRVFARELGAAISSTNLMPPETLGHSGFAVNVELSVLNLAAHDADDVAEGEFLMPVDGPGRANRPMLIPSIHIRKGFPFSLEVGARAAWIDRSHMGVGTLEGKWAVNEGFLYLPDVAVRAYVTRLFNSDELSLTTWGLDLGVGREFPIGGMITLTPYAGYNLGFVHASSYDVNFNARPVAETSQDPYTILGDIARYQAVNGDSHNRFYAGLRFIGGVIQLGVEVSFVSLGKIGTNEDPALTEDRSLPAITSVATTLGLDF